MTKKFEVKEYSVDRGNSNVYRVEISPKSILIVLLIGVSIYIGSKMVQVFLITFFAFAIASALIRPFRTLVAKGFSKSFSLITVYSATFLFLLAIIFTIIVPFIQEISTLSEKSPKYVTHISENVADLLKRVGYETNSDKVYNASKQFYQEQVAGGAVFDSGSISTAVDAFSIVGTVAGGIFIALIISAYIVYDHDNFLDFLLLQIVHDKKRELVKQLIIDVESKLGGWIVGQGTDSLIVAGLTWLLLIIADVPFALPLALFAGLLVTVPTFGPLLASVPAMAIGFASSGILTVFAIGFGYTLIQQIENLIIVPRIMGNVVGVKPIVVILGVLIGLSLAGILGAILTVPTLVILKISYEFYISYRKLEAVEG